MPRHRLGAQGTWANMRGLRSGACRGTCCAPAKRTCHRRRHGSPGRHQHGTCTERYTRYNVRGCALSYSDRRLCDSPARLEPAWLAQDVLEACCAFPIIIAGWSARSEASSGQRAPGLDAGISRRHRITLQTLITGLGCRVRPKTERRHRHQPATSDPPVQLSFD